jgi:hypothetical protein
MNKDLAPRIFNFTIHLNPLPKNASSGVRPSNLQLKAGVTGRALFSAERIIC